MYSIEQRKLAIETYIKFDLSAADTVAELGYPTRQSLRAWYKDYLEHGEISHPPPKRQRDPRFTLEMRQAAVDCYLAHGKSLARTMRKMGYPAAESTSAIGSMSSPPAGASTGARPKARTRRTRPMRGTRSTRLRTRNRSRIPANRGRDDNATANTKGDPFIHQLKGHHPHRHPKMEEDDTDRQRQRWCCHPGQGRDSATDRQ